MNKKMWTGIAVVLAVAAIAVVAYMQIGESDQLYASDEFVTVRYGDVPAQGAALIYAAQEMGAFEKHGVTVEMTEFLNGNEAFDALENGDIDIVFSAEYPVATRIMRGNNLKILSAVNSFNHGALIGDTEQGITEDAQSLLGKKIGVAKGSVVDFYLSTFLKQEGIDATDVTITNVIPRELNSIDEADVDAMAALHPVTGRVRSEWAGHIVEWPLQNDIPGYALLVAQGTYVQDEPEAVERVMRALDEANTYRLENPDAFKEITRKRLDLSTEQIDRIWDTVEIGLGLDQTLLVVLENESEWAIENGVVEREEVPNYLDSMYFDALKRVDPELVGILH
jgi:NitT/TauT family transport system substrate-binding protein